MKIVVLDGYTLNPGDLSWDALKSLGECTVYEHSAAEETVSRAQEAEVLLTNKTVVDRSVIEQLPGLKYVGLLATGYNVVDIEAARERGIPVTNVPSYGTRSVAQMVFAHILNLTQRVVHHADTVSSKRWCESRDFCYWDFPLIELEGLMLGIVGFGRIGRAVADLGKAFGMRILAHDMLPIQDEGVQASELDNLFRECDVISLHCPLTDENTGMVNATRLALMKPTAFLVNTSRGPLIDEPALAEALNAGRLAGAGLDVLAVEPPVGDNPLLSAKNCFVTPHIAWATRSARSRLLNTVVANVKAFMKGNAQNVVNGV